MTGDAGPLPGLLLRDATLADGHRVDVRVAGDLIAEVGPTPARPPTSDGNAEVVDLGGWLLLPAPAEPHAHVDKALTAHRVPNPTGDLGGAVEAWLRYRPGLPHDDLVRRASEALWRYVAHGTTVVRTHVDVGSDIGLRALEAMVEVRAWAGGACGVELVAFVGAPVTGAAGADHRALLRAALDSGADVVGGAPHLDPDPAGCVAQCLSVAADHRMPLDLHVDEVLDPAAPGLPALLDAVGGGYPYGVAASHCVSLAAMPVDRVRTLADRMAAAGITLVCLPATNLYLQGRPPSPADSFRAGDPVRATDPVRPADPVGPADAAGRPRGLPPLDLLLAAGVTVTAGGDNLQDPFHPLGRGDPLETAGLLVTAGHLRPDAAYQAVTAGARAALGLAPAGVTAGAPADLLAVPARDLPAALAEAPAERLVVRAGRVVARTTVTRQVDVSPPPAAPDPGGPP